MTKPIMCYLLEALQHQLQYSNFYMSSRLGCPLEYTRLKELLLCVELLDFVYSLSDQPDPDFSADTIDIIIPAHSSTFAVSTFFTINDDNIDEDEQSFAIVAEILDVPEDISCFQTAPGTIPCFGTRGATEIRITDNDRELLINLFCNWTLFIIASYPYFSLSYGHWIHSENSNSV